MISYYINEAHFKQGEEEEERQQQHVATVPQHFLAH